MKILYYAYVGISSLALDISDNKRYTSGRTLLSPTLVTPWPRFLLSADVTIWVDGSYLNPLPPSATVCPRFAKSGPLPRQDIRAQEPADGESEPN
jgi:hypothetical protein